MNDAYIVKFVSQHCVGYSPDFTRTYYEGSAEFSDGTTRKVYGDKLNQPLGKFTFELPVDWTETIPVGWWAMRRNVEVQK